MAILSHFREAGVHRFFEVALLLKAIHSVLEIIGASVLFLASQQAIVGVAKLFTHAELIEDPDDRIANYVIHSAQHLSAADKASAAFFLLSHGTVKLFLVGAVMLGKPWAYPLFMAALAGLIVFQTYQLLSGFSFPLFGLTIVDIIVLWLTVHEYRIVRQRRQSTASQSR